MRCLPGPLDEPREPTPRKRLAPLVSAGLAFALAFGSALVPAPFGSPKLAFFGSLAVYALLVAAIRPLRETTRAWLRFGALDGRILGFTLAVSLVSIIGLAAYEALVGPDIVDLRAQLPCASGASLAAFALILCLVNALSEEAVYRGVLLHALESELETPWLAILLQGVAFGAPHATHGFPRGPIGLVLTSGYGILLGALRRARTGSPPSSSRTRSRISRSSRSSSDPRRDFVTRVELSVRRARQRT